MSRRFVRAHPFGSQKAKRKISGKSVAAFQPQCIGGH